MKRGKIVILEDWLDRRAEIQWLDYQEHPQQMRVIHNQQDEAKQLEGQIVEFRIVPMPFGEEAEVPILNDITSDVEPKEGFSGIAVFWIMVTIIVILALGAMSWQYWKTFIR